MSGENENLSPHTWSHVLSWHNYLSIKDGLKDGSRWSAMGAPRKLIEVFPLLRRGCETDRVSGGQRARYRNPRHARSRRRGGGKRLRHPPPACCRHRRSTRRLVRRARSRRSGPDPGDLRLKPAADPATSRLATNRKITGWSL